MDSSHTGSVPAETDRPGWFTQTLTQLFMKSALVVDRERVADRFHLVTLESPQFQGFDWIPGQKLQVRIGSSLATRTYTPIEWDAENGRTRILGYAHGNGPGSAWVAGVARGEACHVFGPRASLDLRGAIGPVAVIGDETSIGLVHALAQHPERQVRGLLEVDDGARVRQALARLGLRDVDGFERQPDHSHMEALVDLLPALAAAGTCFVLTAKAASIQRVRRVLKDLQVPSGRLAAKAYWAPGKTGLD